MGGNLIDRYDAAFTRLLKSNFRSRFHLSSADRKYIAEKGMETIRSHCEDFIRTRLAPANPPNDGKQTPMRGHPVFKAQHACACCCRDCLVKWWHVPRGVEIPAGRRNRCVSGAATHRDAAKPSGLSVAKRFRECRAGHSLFPHGVDRAGMGK